MAEELEHASTGGDAAQSGQSRGADCWSRRGMRGTAIVAVVVGALFGAPSAFAQDWPTRTVKVVVPNGAGGVSGKHARLTSDRMSKMFNQPFVVENKGGAGGSIGTEYAARSAPDGYTLYFGGGAQFLVNPLLKKLPYDPLKDLVPISMVSLN